MQKGGGPHKNINFKPGMEFNSNKQEVINTVLISIKEFQERTGLMYNVKLNDILLDICMHIEIFENGPTEVANILIEYLVEHENECNDLYPGKNIEELRMLI